MRQTRLAYDYASALFFLAKEEKIEKEIYDDILKISYAVKNDKHIVGFMQCPSIMLEEKMEFLNNIFDSSKLLISFFELAIRKKIFWLMADIEKNYGRLLDKKNNTEHIQIISANELEEEKKEKIVKKLSSVLGRNIMAEYLSDKNIVSGLIIKYRDKILDGSLRTQFSILKKLLSGECQ